MTRSPARPFVLGLLAIGAVALAVRVAYALIVEPVVPEVGDAMAYHHLGSDLAAGRGYIRPFDLRILGEVRPSAEYPPLFPAVLALADLAGIDSVTGQRLMTCGVGTVGVALTGLVGRAVATPRVGLVAAGLAALHPQWFQADAILMSETLFVPLVALVVLLAVSVTARPDVPRLAALGLAIGLAALTRGEALLLLPLLVVPAVVRGVWGGPARLSLGAVAALVTLAVLAPWAARNAARFGELVPLSNNLGTAVDGANCGPTYGGEGIGLWRYVDGGDECFEGFDLSSTDEAEAAREHRDEGVRYAADHPGRLPAVAAARIGRTWGVFRPRQQAFVESLEGRTVRWQLLATRLHWGLLAAAAAGAVLLVRRVGVARTWPLLGPLVVVTLTTAAVYGNSRFRAAAEPSLAVLAAVAVVAVLERRARIASSG